MDELRKQDLKLWAEEFFAPSRLFVGIIIGIGVYPIFHQNLISLGLTWGVLLFVLSMMALSASVERRFKDRRMRALWKGCEERLARFEEALKRMRKDQVADLQEMPQTIRGVSKGLYFALRRADQISVEVAESEKGLYDSPPVTANHGHDPQSKELYRIADKNIAEYRQQFQAVMSGVRRTEAQAAVFMTTVDTLRMKMIGYRLVNKSPALSSQDFLEAMAEARAQLQSIDTALDELDLSHYPKTISVVDGPSEDNIRA
ncbi:hypothetical protein MCEMSE15_03110 [Fimbriimonadaceae bacterium]